MQLLTLVPSVIPLVWLLPNHYLPWLSAWQDGCVLALLGLALLMLRHDVSLPRPWGAVLALASVSVAMQWVTGRILFGGDALMVLVYLAALAASLLVGGALAVQRAKGHFGGLEAWALATVLAAMLSVGVALVQWTGAASLGIYGADLPPRERPFGNVAQPNHMCTIAFLGLCAVGLLREAGQIGKATSRLAALFFALGMLLTVSRTGWLQWALLLLGVALLRGRTRSGIGAAEVACGAGAFAVLTACWPDINDALLLSAVRAPLAELVGGTGRVQIWAVLLDAVGREPLWGHGWQQVGVAIQVVALDNEPLLAHTDRGHNLFIDLLVWAGIPVGGALIGLILWAVASAVRTVREPRALWLLLMVGGIGAHAMLELPHEYAYFLVPVGLALGALHALAHPAVPVPGVPWKQRGTAVCGLVLLAAIAGEYLQAETSHRLLRLESARIGTSRIESTAPDLYLLTQLQSFLAFARTEARPGMTPEELAQMRKVSQRYAFAPAMLRYAMAAGLNGEPQLAERTLATLCSMQSTQRCVEGREAWQSAQGRYPVLAAVRYPPAAPR